MFWREEGFDMSKTFFQFAGQGRSGRRSSGRVRDEMIIRNSNSKSFTVLAYPKSHWISLLWPQKIYMG